MKRNDTIENFLNIAKGFMCGAALWIIIWGVSNLASTCQRQKEKEI